MRRLLLVFTTFVAIGAFFQPGSAYALGIGPIQLPDFDSSVSVNDQPGTRIKPSWLPANLGENATVVLVPGTTDYDGADQLKRSRDIGFYDSADPDDPAYYNPTSSSLAPTGTTTTIPRPSASPCWACRSILREKERSTNRSTSEQRTP